MASIDSKPHMPRPQDDDSSLFQNYSMNGKIIISALGILFFMVFVIIVLHMYAKWCRQRRSNMQQRTLSRLRMSFSSAQDPTCSKPIGLDREVVEALPIFTYIPQLFTGANLGRAGAKPAECAVCLAEFQQDETCKLLPKCKHFFHVGCIDMWFLSHATCPLCRATPGLLLVDEEAGGHYVDGSCDEQGQEEEQRKLRCMHGGRNHIPSGDEESQPGDDGNLSNIGVSLQARKWRRSFSDKFPRAVKEAVPSSNHAHMAPHIPMMVERSLSHITTRQQDSHAALSSYSSISSLVSPRWVSSHPHVYPPPLLRGCKSLTRVFSK